MVSMSECFAEASQESQCFCKTPLSPRQSLGACTSDLLCWPPKLPPRWALSPCLGDLDLNRAAWSQMAAALVWTRSIFTGQSELILQALPIWHRWLYENWFKNYYSMLTNINNWSIWKSWCTTPCFEQGQH